MAKMFNTLTQRINKILWIITVICLMGVVLFCFLQVFTRFVIKAPLLGAEELARLFFVWMVYSAAGLCTAQGTHAAVTIFVEKLPEKGRFLFNCILNIVVLFFTFIVMRYGRLFVMETFNQQFGSIRMSIAYANSSILMCGFSIFINSLNNLIQNITAFRANASGSSGKGGNT